MSVLEFTSVVLIVSTGAGFRGALTGPGGGIVITPVLTLVGATLISAIATYSGARQEAMRRSFLETV